MNLKIIYVKNSNERAESLAIRTKLYESDGGVRFAVKYPATKKAEPHVDKMVDTAEKLSTLFEGTDIKVLPPEKWDGGVSFPYIEGETLLDEMEGLIADGRISDCKKILTDRLAMLRQLHQQEEFVVTDEFRQIFGDIETGKKYRCASYNNIDMVLDNFVRCEEGYYLMDYEWAFDFPIPIDFILYRIVHYFVHRSNYRDELIKNGFLNILGSDSSETALFEKMEKNFQDYVVQGITPIREYYGKMGAAAVPVSGALSTPTGRIYYDLGDGFNEDDSEIFAPESHGDFLELNMELPEGTSAVRIDPIEGMRCIVKVALAEDENGRDLLKNIKSNGIKKLGEWYFLDTADPWLGVFAPLKRIRFVYNYTLLDDESVSYYPDIMKSSRIKKDSVVFKILRKIKKGFGILGKLFVHFRKGGVHGALRYMRIVMNERGLVYQHWFLKHRATSEELTRQREDQKNLSYRPKFSILVPVYRTPERTLKEMIESVLSQTYDNLELCIADGSMDDGKTRRIIETYDDPRLIYKELTENKGISGNTNEALALATGDYIALLDHDDLLELNALYEVAASLQEKKYDILYTDEDKVNEKTTQYMDPNLKPDFSMDLFRSHNYITHFYVCKKSIVVQVGGFRSEFDGAQDYDLMFRCIEVSDSIYHIPKVLYHWRMIKGSTAENPESKMYAYEAGRRAVEEHLKRLGIPATVEHTDMWAMYHTTYHVTGEHLVSIVIANKDHTDDLDKCIRSIERKSTYRDFEIIVVENNSEESGTFEYYDRITKEFDNVKVIKWEREFNYSAINNFGVSHASGDYILLLNNDTELITPTAISEMLGICLRDDVGIVGAKLLYGDDTIQHAGVVIGFGGYAGHVFHGAGRNENVYMLRTRINCNYSAVTAACLMIRKSVFEEVGGLTEEFVVAGNDVDLCLKVREKGYLVVYSAFSEWYHYESKSRGYEDTPEKQARFQSEVEKFRARWGKILEEGDPFYNPNFPVTQAPFTLE